MHTTNFATRESRFYIVPWINWCYRLIFWLFSLLTRFSTRQDHKTSWYCKNYLMTKKSYHRHIHISILKPILCCWNRFYKHSWNLPQYKNISLITTQISCHIRSFAHPCVSPSIYPILKFTKYSVIRLYVRPFVRPLIHPTFPYSLSTAWWIKGQWTGSSHV